MALDHNDLFTIEMTPAAVELIIRGTCDSDAGDRAARRLINAVREQGHFNTADRLDEERQAARQRRPGCDLKRGRRRLLCFHSDRRHASADQAAT